MKKPLSIVLVLAFISIYAFGQQPPNYQDYVRGVESTYDEDSEAKRFEEFKRQQDSAYQKFVSEQEEAYRKYVEEVEKKWSEFIGSTNRQWVEYSEDKSVRSIVNFEEADTPEEKPVEEPEKTQDAKPEEESETKPEEKTGTKPEAEKVESEVKPEEEPQTKPEKEQEIKVAEEPKTKPEEVKTVTKPETKEETPEPEKKPEIRSEEEQEAKVAEKPETKPDKEPEMETEVKPEAKKEKPEVKPEKKLQIEPEKEPAIKPEEEQEVEMVEKPEEEPPAAPEAGGKGQITVEAVVEADDPDAENKAKKMIAAHIEKLFSSENDAKKNVLEGQIKTKSGEVVTARSVGKFVQEEVLPKAKTHPKRIKSKDGVERVKVSVVIPMVPRHLEVRAKDYLNLVTKYCRKYEQDLPLVMAVIQTESYFNPLAKSHIPAYGLMQVVPKYAGRDANKYVFKKDEDPKPRYLYVPENNLILGIAYLHLLRERYFYGIKDPTKQEYLVIASYNGGMGTVIRKMLKKYQVPEMSSSEVYDALRKEMPDETKDYLAKVTTRKKNYLAWQ